MEISVRDVIRDFSAYVPGKSIEEIRQTYGLKRIIKLASNENALGVSPLVQEVLARRISDVFRYARAASPRLCQKLAEKLRVLPEQIVVGNGSDEIIDLLLRVVPTPGRDNVVMFRPSFSMYELQAKLCGVDIRKVPLEADFHFSFAKMKEQIDENTRLVFVTSPDNPSGYACLACALADFAASLPPKCLLVVDQAYVDFCEPCCDFDMVRFLEKSENIVILRTFSKAYGLAGLRLGYGIMPPMLAEYLLRVKLPFSVNLLAEEAGLAALDDEEFLQKSLSLCKQERTRVSERLRELGAAVFPSQANFCMFRPSVAAKRVNEELLLRGVIIRPLLSGYDLGEYLRVTFGTVEENDFFLHCCEEIFHG